MRTPFVKAFCFHSLVSVSAPVSLVLDTKSPKFRTGLEVKMEQQRKEDETEKKSAKQTCGVTRILFFFFLTQVHYSPA